MAEQAYRRERPEQVSLWEPPPQRAPAPQPPPAPARRRPPWYRRAWFVGLVVVAVSGTAGAALGSHLP